MSEVAPRRVVGDVAVGLVAFAVAAWVMLSSAEATPRDPDVAGIGLLLAAAGLLVVRRRRPVAVLVAIVVITSFFLRLGYAGGAELPLVMVALYATMAEGHRPAGLVVLGLLVSTGVSYRLLVDRDDPLLVAVTVTLLILVVALGDGARTRRELRTQVRERLRAMEVEKELEAQAQLTAERLRIARELHDVLAHTITAIAVQAGAAADGLDGDSEAHATLRSMRTTAHEAMHQLRATIELLRSDHLPRPTLAAPDLSGLDALADGVREAGVEVEVDTRGQARRLPAAVELTGYRIVQEALTNVLRHADAGRAWVSLAYRADGLEVIVTDDGSARPGPATGVRGFGIVGMRERAQALGGTLDVHHDDAGGFRVHAVLPTGEKQT